MSATEQVKEVETKEQRPKVSQIFGGPAEVTFMIRVPGVDLAYEVAFEPLDVETKTRWANIRTGRSGRGKGEPIRADMFLFEKKFIRTNIDWEGELERGGYASEKEFFLKDKQGRLHMDEMINAYLGERPTRDDLNE